MKSFKAYLMGWSSTLRLWKLVLLLYVLNFLVALVSLIPLSSFLNQTVGQSLSLNRSLAAFDYLFLSDFFNTYGEGVKIILNQSIVLLILNFLFSIFLMGGIVASIKRKTQRFSFNEYWKSCAYYFGRFFRLTIYFLFFQLGLLGIFCMIFIANGISPFELESETEMIHCLRVFLPIYIACVTLLLMWQDYSKIHLVQQDKRFLFKPIWESFLLVCKNIIPFLFLYLLNIGSFLLLCVVYYQLNHTVQPDNMTAITLVFLLGQTFILGRTAMKVVNLASITNLYTQTVLAEDSLPPIA